MLVADLLHSCANPRVAQAAICSIGGDFARRLRVEAEEAGASVGAHVASIVRDFAIAASERDWRDLVSALRGQDHPLLVGLRVIVDRRSARLPVSDRRARSAPVAPQAVHATAA